MAEGKGGEEKTYVNIDGLKIPDVLSALYNAAKPLDLEQTFPMGSGYAANLLQIPRYSGYIDTIDGRKLMLDLRESPQLDVTKYNRHNGAGVAEEAIKSLRERTIDITGLDKAELFAALYNASRPQGLGILNYDPADMLVEEAEQILYSGLDRRSEYTKGRPIKVDLSGDTLDPRVYDADHGKGAAQKIVEAVRAKQVKWPSEGVGSETTAEMRNNNKRRLN